MTNEIARGVNSAIDCGFVGFRSAKPQAACAIQRDEGGYLFACPTGLLDDHGLHFWP